MKDYICVVCGMKINEKNLNLNSAGYMSLNTEEDIKYCPFCGAEGSFIIASDDIKVENIGTEFMDNITSKIIDSASKLEVFNSDFYKEASKLAENSKVKEMFLALSNIELMHARIHVKLLGGIDLPQVSKLNYDKYKGDDSLLKLACLREKHAVEFYNRHIKDISIIRVKKIFEALSNVEQSHILMTQE